MASQIDFEEFRCGTAHVRIYPSQTVMANPAADGAAVLIQAAVRQNGLARILVATGNSQLGLLEALAARHDLDWKAVEVFHLDEYVGLPPTHPSSFRHWIKLRVEDRLHPYRMNYLNGDAADLDAEIARYSSLLDEKPINVGFVGFGENGHIAFNDPPVADFEDPLTVKRVLLDEACRRQQAGEGHFQDLDAVPKEAVTVTCAALLRVGAWICYVPDERKAAAVRDALEGPIATSCPASIVRTHPNATVFLDAGSASKLTKRPN